jgi:superfamily II DNA or RNA helicase
LFDYQRDAVTAVERSYATGVQRTSLVLPTGGGKTVVFSHAIARAGVKTLVVAHREELISQAAEKVRAVAPHLKVGIVKADRDEHDGYDVVVASVQTLARDHRRRAITGIGFVVVDECHHAVAPTYRAVLAHFGCFRPGGARALGVTATMARADREALGDVWQEIAYRLDILDLIEHQPPRLADVRGIQVRTPGLDLTRVRAVAGDYNIGVLVDAMDDAGAWDAAADAYAEHARERQGLAFTPDVASAHTLAEALTRRGITAEAVDGTTPTEQRAGILGRFATGHTQVVTNCGVLTEGYDAPWCSAVLIARPTRSDTLYVQMAGRGLRVHPGKTDALVIDMVGVTADKTLRTLACLTGRDVGEVPDGASLAEAHAAHVITSTTASPYLGLLTATEVELFDTSRVIWPQWRGIRCINIAAKHQTVYLARQRPPAGST